MAIIKNNCITVANPPKEVIDKLSEVKTPQGVAWVVKFDQLLETWTNKKICPQTIRIK